LKQTAGSAQLELTGWVPLTGPEGRDKKPGAAPRLDLAVMRPMGVAEVTTRVGLEPAPRLRLVRPGLRQPTRAAGPAGLTYEARTPSYGGSFAVEVGPTPKVTTRTRLEARGKDVIFTSTIDFVQQGGARALTVRLRDWEGEAWLEAPAGAIAHRRER